MLCPELLILCSTPNVKLQVGREDGKKGSVKPVEWDEDSRLAFENFKKSLSNCLETFQNEPNERFILRTDTSDFALGGVLEQQREGNGFQWHFTVAN